jgi:hypothetical protein
MNISNKSYNQKLIVSILIYAFIAFLGFHSYSLAETSQKGKEAKEVKDTKTSTYHSDEKTDNRKSALPKEPSGYEVFIDPKTGKFIGPPKDVPVTREEEGINSLETQQVEEPAIEMPAPGGGVMLEQPGGFLHDSTATIDKDGNIHTDCSKHDENPSKQSLGGGKVGSEFFKDRR